ncbi:hypothetical protein [Haliscomenobacter sp.]|uniref:hypothetical protein n=1 Tax=Haliscomenobacter sp. TaxID=2717303 RepID=UPI003594640D
MKLLLPILLYCLLPVSSIAQESGVNLLHHYRQILPFEKVYLHTDQRVYEPGDMIWFRAYVTDDHNRPKYGLENKLRVQLLDPQGEILLELNLNVLPDELANCALIPNDAEEGIYTLRAATPWLFNFGQDAFFEQKIWVQKPNDVAESNKYSIPLPPSKIQVQFFPEGGDLVADFKQKVAFKISDSQGKSLAGRGTLFNSQQQPLLTFESFHRGMGSFSFTPQKGEPYAIQVEGFPDTFFLPIARNDELAMRLELPTSDSLPVVVWKRHPGTAQVLLRCKDSIVWQQKWMIPAGETKLSTPISQLPVGIAQVLLLDEAGRPFAERLVFLHQARQARVQLKTQQTYVSQDEVKIDIKASDDNGAPLDGLFSLAVVNDEYWAMTDHQADNILSRLLLSAELKGKIEAPAFYFNPDEPKAPAALDLVMLTHGWRKFSWKEILNIDPQKSGHLVPFPKLLEIRGRINVYPPKLLAQTKIRLEGQKKIIRPDSLGYFKFVLPDTLINSPPSIVAILRNMKRVYPSAPLLLPQTQWPWPSVVHNDTARLTNFTQPFIRPISSVAELGYRARKVPKSLYEPRSRLANLLPIRGVSIYRYSPGFLTSFPERNLPRAWEWGDDLYIGGNLNYRYLHFQLELEVEESMLEVDNQKQMFYTRLFADLSPTPDPDYEVLRNKTIYWAPKVVLKNGLGSVNFRHPTSNGTYRVILEGIGNQGEIARSEAIFTVHKK